MFEFVTFFFFSECMHYETLGTQHPSLQCQIACCLITHPADVPAPLYDWNDMAVSSAQTAKRAMSASVIQGCTNTESLFD